MTSRCSNRLSSLTRRPASGELAITARRFGVVGDGKTDDTAPLQKTLNVCAEQGGGIVTLDRGTYAIHGRIEIPAHVTLEGVRTSPTAWAEDTDSGTTLLAYDGRGEEAGPAFITVNTSAMLRGVAVFYPEQTGNPASPYPWCISGSGDDASILDCLLVNPYQAIDMATRSVQRHFISRVSGSPLRRGIFVDQCYDVGRIENVHFWPFWKPVIEDSIVRGQIHDEAEAFHFARTDWQYVLNTFCWGYKVGYRFVESDHGVCNGNFLGIGADACNVSVQVDACAPFGLLIANGEFVAMDGRAPKQIVIGEANTGTVQFNNCSFWGPTQQVARIHGEGFTSFNQCNFLHSPRSQFPCVQVESGSILLNACRFSDADMAVHIGPEVASALVTSNMLSAPDSVQVAQGVHATIEANHVFSAAGTRSLPV